MSEPDFTNAPLPPDFKAPPGMPPIPANPNAAAAPHGPNVAQDTSAPWWVWALGLGGLGGMLGLVYVAYHAAPIALRVYAPELAPHMDAYQAAKKAGDTKKKRDAVAEAVQELLAEQAKTQVYR